MCCSKHTAQQHNKQKPECKHDVWVDHRTTSYHIFYVAQFSLLYQHVMAQFNIYTNLNSFLKYIFKNTILQLFLTVPILTTSKKAILWQWEQKRILNFSRSSTSPYKSIHLLALSFCCMCIHSFKSPYLILLYHPAHKKSKLLRSSYHVYQNWAQQIRGWDIAFLISKPHG